MHIAQIIALIYAGMLIENPQKRQQFMGFINNAGTSIEGIVKDFTGKGGAVDNVPTEPAAGEPEYQ